MSIVQGVMRASQEEYKALEKAARKAGATTEFTATQSAKALEYMGMAGWDAQKSIKALPLLLQFATAASMDLGQASDIVTDGLTAMGMGINDLQRYLDVLIGTTTRSNTDVLKMGETMKYAAPLAHQLGIEIETLSALTGILASSNVKGSISGTGLTAVMVKNVAAAKELGTKYNDIVGTLKAAKDANWDLTKITKIYGQEALKTVLVLMDKTDVLKDMEDQLRKTHGETEKLASTKMDTLKAEFAGLVSAIEGAGLAIYDGLEKDVRGSIAGMTQNVRGASTDFEHFGKFIGDFFEKDIPEAVEIAKASLDTFFDVLFAVEKGILFLKAFDFQKYVPGVAGPIHPLNYLKRGLNLKDDLQALFEYDGSFFDYFGDYNKFRDYVKGLKEDVQEIGNAAEEVTKKGTSLVEELNNKKEQSNKADQERAAQEMKRRNEIEAEVQKSIDRTLEKQIEAARASLKEYKAVGGKRADVIKSLQKTISHLEQRQSKRRQSELKAEQAEYEKRLQKILDGVRKRVEAEEDAAKARAGYVDEYNRLTMDSYEYEKHSILQRYEAEKKAHGASLELARLKDAQLRDLEKRRLDDFREEYEARLADTKSFLSRLVGDWENAGDIIVRELKGTFEDAAIDVVAPIAYALQEAVKSALATAIVVPIILPGEEGGEDDRTCCVA